MFNGRDLTGWTNINCAPETWSVRDGKIYCTGKPVGGLRTERQYENFIVELEWRHLQRSGNSGFFAWGSPINAPGVPFLRGIEVQILDQGYAEDFEKKNGKKSESFTTHGDVFAIHGATMAYVGKTNGKRSFPTEDRSKPSPEWNHYRIVANNGSLRLHVNGKEISGGDNANYRKGYLALESEGAPVEFRNLRIKELPSTGANASNTAPLDPGWRAIFNSVDLRGWRTNAATAARWSVVGEKLVLKAEPADQGDVGPRSSRRPSLVTRNLSSIFSSRKPRSARRGQTRRSRFAARRSISLERRAENSAVLRLRCAPEKSACSAMRSLPRSVRSLPARRSVVPSASLPREPVGRL